MATLDDDPTEYPLGPSLEFMQQLWQLNHSLERISRSMERRLGVTAPQRLILRAVGKFPGITAGQLARLLHVDPGTVSAALNRLDEKGLVDRRRDPRDKRRAALGLTAKGRALGLPAAGTVERAVELMLDETQAADVVTTRAVISRLTALLDAQIRDDPSAAVSATVESPRRPRRTEQALSRNQPLPHLAAPGAPSRQRPRSRSPAACARGGCVRVDGACGGSAARASAQRTHGERGGSVPRAQFSP